MKKLHYVLGKFGIPVYCLILGLSIAMGLNGLFESQFENEILNNVAKKIVAKTKGQSEEDRIDTAINLCHYLQVRRSEILGNGEYHSFKATTFRTSLQSFYIGTGACGYYSMFAARVFQKLGYQPKIVQQRVHDRWGAHITLALPLKHNGKLILVDPLFKHTFRDTQNHLSTINQVKTNWNSYYSHHLPANYNPNYNYQQGWRHTNWDKFGALSRFTHKILVATIGQTKTDALSFRMLIIDAYRVQSFIAFTISVLCLVMIAIGRKINRR